MPTVILDKKFDRDGLINSLKVNEIDARPFFHPVSSFPEFNLSIENNISTHLSIYGINLPSAFDLSLEDIRYICDLIKEYLK
jgi:perosamine synthetase